MIPEGLHYTKDHEWVRVEGAEIVADELLAGSLR